MSTLQARLPRALPVLAAPAGPRHCSLIASPGEQRRCTSHPGRVAEGPPPNPTYRLLLMDQSVVAGIGNIYRAEILYKAGVHPVRALGWV